MLVDVRKALDTALVDDAVNGAYQVGRQIFTDADIFELEMKHIFEETGYTWRMKARSPIKTTISPPRWAASRSSSRVTRKAR